MMIRFSNVGKEYDMNTEIQVVFKKKKVPPSISQKKQNHHTA